MIKETFKNHNRFGVIKNMKVLNQKTYSDITVPPCVVGAATVAGRVVAAVDTRPVVVTVCHPTTQINRCLASDMKWGKDKQTGHQAGRDQHP